MNRIYLLCLLTLISQLSADSDLYKNFENRYKEINKPQTSKSNKVRSSSNGIAILDLKLALLFHPLMKDYNFTVHSFIKPIPKNLNVPINFYLKNRVKESRAMVLKSKQTYTDLQAEQLQVQQKISSMIYKKASNIRRIMSSSHSNTESELESFRSNYQQKLKQLQLRKLSITQDIVNTYSSSFGIHYMTRKERNKLLKTIEKEVLESAKIVLKSQKLSILLNGNYLENTTARDIPKLAWVDKNFNGVNALNFYFRRQHQVVDDEIQAYSAQGGADLFDPFYKNLNKVPSIFGKNYDNRFVLLGGKNITKATLQVLYKKHNKPNVVRDILSFIQKIKENKYE